MTPWVTRIIMANVGVFLITETLPLVGLLLGIEVSVRGFLLRPWTLVTYMFVHADFMHIFFNMLVLFFFGPPLESHLGSRKFLTLYFVSGLAGAGLSLFFAIGPPVRMVGASGAVYGVTLAFAMLWPTASIFLMGIIPVQARWLVGLMAAYTFYAGFFGPQDGVAHFAHLGGFLGAYQFMRYQRNNAGNVKFKKRVYANDERNPRRDDDDARRWAAISREGLHEVNRDEVDRLLEKIGKSGVASLTIEERAFLNRFSGAPSG